MGINSEVKTKAVFLDRDGVVNQVVILEGKPFPPDNLKELVILPGVITGIKILKKNGFRVFIITNQPDVARGKTPISIVEEINSFLTSTLDIDEIFCCFHDSNDNCSCRKPKPGMILDAATKWNIDLHSSYMIGDRWRDIDCAKAAGVSSILLKYDYDEKVSIPDFEGTNFEDAINYILTK